MSAYGYTANFKFTLINFATPAWQTEEYANWRMLDSVLAEITPTNPAQFPVTLAYDAVHSAYDAVYTPSLGSITQGEFVYFIADIANPAAITKIQINGGGYITIKYNGTDIPAGSIQAGAVVKLVYVGTSFEMVEPKILSTTVANGSITPAKLSTGHPTWDSGTLITNFAGAITAPGTISGTNLYRTTGGNSYVAITHADSGFNTATVTFSTSDPSGGFDGDIWYKHA